MEKFYTDKPNLFECNIHVDGANINETKARLVLQLPNDKNLLFYGTVNNNGKCKITLPPLKEFNESKGNAILEVIAEETFLEPWKGEFQIIPSKRVQVEMIVNSDKEKINETIKPKITITENSFNKNQILEEFSDYILNNNVDFNNVVNDKNRLINLLLLYKSENNVPSNNIEYLTESIISLVKKKKK